VDPLVRAEAAVVSRHARASFFHYLHARSGLRQDQRTSASPERLDGVGGLQRQPPFLSCQGLAGPPDPAGLTPEGLWVPPEEAQRSLRCLAICGSDPCQIKLQAPYKSSAKGCRCPDEPPNRGQ